SCSQPLLTLSNGRWDSDPTLNENPGQEAGPATQDPPVEEPSPADAAEPTSTPPGEPTLEAATPDAEAADPAAEGAAPASEEPATSTEIDIGNVVEGTVQRITPYGAFVQLAGGKVGLIHISEIDRNYGKDVHEFLRQTDVVKAEVRMIKEDGKIDLSIKAMQDPQRRLQRRG